MCSKNPWKHDLEITPKQKYLKKDFDVFCTVNFPKHKKLGGEFEFSRLNLMLHVRVFKNREEQLKSIIEVNSYRTIVTQNRKVSITIVKLFTESI